MSKQTDGTEINLYLPIEDHYAGDYRLEYDGKYLTLFGKDNRYTRQAYGGKGQYIEEMVLIPCVVEKKGIYEYGVIDESEDTLLIYWKVIEDESLEV